MSDLRTELLSLGTEALVSRARSGEGAAFEELYRRYCPAVTRRLSHLLGPAGPVADLVQESFEQAWRGLPRLRGEGCFATWLLRIAQNAARGYYRRSQRSLWRLWDRPEQEHDVPAPSRDDGGGPSCQPRRVKASALRANP